MLERIKTRARTRPRDRGQTSVEFAVSIIVLLILIFGVLQFSLYVYSFTVMASAAKHGVRYAVVHGALNGSPSGPGSTAAVEGEVRRIADYSGMTITVTYPDGNNEPLSRVNVRVSAPFTPFLVGGLAATTISGASEGRILH